MHYISREYTIPINICHTTANAAHRRGNVHHNEQTNLTQITSIQNNLYWSINRRST